MNKFEQLIEFVINDDEKNAKALFHEIVVEKSKDIGEDESKKLQQEVQKQTDLHVKMIDEKMVAKESEILKV